MGARELQTDQALDLNVGRWGNSLAVRLPAELARSLGIAEGGTLHVARNKDNTLTVSAQRPRKQFDKAEWLKEAKRHLASMTPSKSVIREMRDAARY
jgi:antitoxin MazE